jgi:hypothetical protein
VHPGMIHAGLRYAGYPISYFPPWSDKTALYYSYTVSTYVEKTGPGNFLPYAFLVAMGQQKRLPT